MPTGSRSVTGCEAERNGREGGGAGRWWQRGLCSNRACDVKLMLGVSNSMLIILPIIAVTDIAEPMHSSQQLQGHIYVS